jgi:hypothetical protein
MKVLGPNGETIDYNWDCRLGIDGKPAEWQRGWAPLGWTRPHPDEEYMYDPMTLANGLVEAFQFVFKMERQNEGKDVPYDGPEITANKLSTGFNIKTSLEAEHIDYSCTPLESLISCAIRLGMEDAYRRILDTAYLTESPVARIREGLENPDDEQARERALKALESLERRAVDPGQVLPALWGQDPEL